MINKDGKYKAEDIIDEFTDYIEKKKYTNINGHVLSVIQHLQEKQISAKTNLEIGDLLATIAESIPQKSAVILNFCDSIASVCVDREFVQFSDEAVTTLIAILLKRAKTFRGDSSSILRAISSLFYQNTLRLKQFHEEVLSLCHDSKEYSEECYKRCCTILGNIAAFSQKTLERSIYTRASRFLMTAIDTKNIELMNPALRSMQLLILDAPMQTYDLQTTARVVSDIAFAPGKAGLRYEALMVLKALANACKSSFYPQWPMLLTKEKSLFMIMKQKARLAKTSADLVADMFRGAYNYMYIANNVDRIKSVTTLSKNLGDTIDTCFDRFFEVLNRNEVTDKNVWSRIATAFSVFVKDVSFDNGKLKSGYLTRVVEWAKANIDDATDDVLLVMKSLLWTSLEFKEFADSFDFIFTTFLNNLKHTSQERGKISLRAFRRIAYAYPQECVKRWAELEATISAPGFQPAAAFQILTRLAENHIEEINIWQDIITTHVPSAFRANNHSAISAAIQCIGQCGFIFSKLEDGIQRECLATVLGNDNEAAYEAIGLLSLSSAPNFSATFLCDGYRKLISVNPPKLRPLSKVIKSLATEHRDQFVDTWLDPLLEVLYKAKSPYKSRCLAFLLPFIKSNEEKTRIITTLCNLLENGEDPQTKWKAASSLNVAIKYGFASHKIVADLYEALSTCKSPKLKVHAAQALSEIQSRELIGELYVPCVTTSIEYLVDVAHFTFLKHEEQKKLDTALRSALVVFFFNLLKWSTPGDFSPLEEVLVDNSDQIYDFMSDYPDAPWESITKLYEKKFSSIPTDLLEKFQDQAFKC